MRHPDQIENTLRAPDYTVAPEIVLTPEGPKRGHCVQVSAGKITSVFEDANPGPSILTLPGYAVVPGFIDAHTHAGQTFGKSLIGGEPAQIWKRIWNPMEAVLTVEGAYVSAKWMFLEAMRGGYTCLVNFAMNDGEKNAAVHRAASETGIKLLSAGGLDEFGEDQNGDRVVHSGDQIKAMVEDHIQACDSVDNIIPSICCTSFFGNSAEALVSLSDLCREHGLKLQIHSNEHFPEVHDCVTRFGLRPIEYLDKIGILGDHLLLHHTTLVTDREVELLAKTGTPVSYNPIASMWKGNAVAPALSFAARGVTFGIGSDTTSADALKNLCAAEACQRVTHGMPVDDFSAGAAWTWTQAASAGSAKAAGIGDQTGFIAEGFAADFLLLDMVRPECLPSHDFEWELVRYYNRDQIDAVVIGGKLTMLCGRPADWDGDAFIDEAMEIAGLISSAPGIERVHGPSGKHRVSG